MRVVSTTDVPMDTGSQDDNAEQPTPPSASWKAMSLDGGAGAGVVESAGVDNEDEVDSGIALVETSLQPMVSTAASKLLRPDAAPGQPKKRPCN